MAKTPEQRTEPVRGNTKWFSPSKPNFVKLREGDKCEGVYLGMGHAQYGVCYKFKDTKSNIIFSLGGNRAQLDQVFSELAVMPQGFVGDTIEGHYLVVMRMPNTESKAGRRVAVYQIGHDLDKCGKGCKG